MKDNGLTQTIMQIAQSVTDIEMDFDRNGNLRFVTTTSKGGLNQNIKQFKSKTTIDELDAFFIADEFVNLPTIKNALGKANIELEMGDINTFAFGYRIKFQQMAICHSKQSPLPVHKGAIHLFINKKGEIYALNSTLQYGQFQLQSKTEISKTEAIRLASASCKDSVAYSWANPMFIKHSDKLNLAYEVTIVCHNPNKSFTCFVLADTGKIIGKQNRLKEFHSQKTCLKISALIKAQALLKTPDPNQPIAEQMNKVIIENLPNPQVLADDYFQMFINKYMDMVYAKDDGSFCYEPSQVEFAAVSVFFRLRDQIKLYLELGMIEPNQALGVVVNDSSLKDNAYFDPLHYEIHLGVGTGVEYGGLNKDIAYDLGVANHEFGHTLAYWQSTDGDLDGEEGAALNEAIGDVLGALVMDYLGSIWYAKQLGGKLTKRRLKDDARVIGMYALPPFGIRTQKNNRSLPADITGEPHADGLIIGGALADCLIAMATQPGKSIEEQIRLFVKINLMALALLPGYKVMFIDMLRTLITADQQISRGQYRSTIERCFARHGIVLGAN